MFNPNEIIIYHNPRCSKSRETLALLQEQGHQPRIIEYLKHPPDAAEIDELLNRLNLQPRELMRTKEKPYLEAGLDNADLARDDLIQAIHDHPILLQRPVVVSNGKAAIGRPPQSVLEIL